jgi:Fe-S-cluster containining protein
MCDGSDFAARRDVWLFDPRIKCCTYYPDLPNFLVGSILADADPGLGPAREVLTARIAATDRVSPLGIHPPLDYVTRFREDPEGFGRRLDFRCPFYRAQDGACGVWSHRPAACATWFCKHDRGAVGAAFWDSLLALLTEVERGLTSWCAATLDARPSEECDAEAWGPWAGRVEAYFKECAQIERRLAWSDIVARDGAEVERLARATRKAYELLVDRGLPERLRRGTIEVMGEESGRVRVVGYSWRDPLELPHWLFEALDCFDGGSPGAALARLAGRTGRWVPSTLVRRLADFGILEDGGGNVAPGHHRT